MNSIRTYLAVVRGFRLIGATWREALTFPLTLPAIAGGSGWINDLRNGVVAGLALRIAAYTATNTGTAVDFDLTVGKVFAILLPGTITDGVHTCKLTECDTSGGQYNDVARGAFSPAASDALQMISAPRTKRYIKATDTVSGLVTTGGVLGVLVFGMNRN